VPSEDTAPGATMEHKQARRDDSLKMRHPAYPLTPAEPTHMQHPGVQPGNSSVAT